MEKLVCKRCSKVIEGYNENHVKYLLKQHQISKKCKEVKKT